MPALFKNVCYPTVEAAKQQACSAASLTWGSGASAFSQECASVTFTGPTMDLCIRQNGGPCQAYTTEYPHFPDCDFAGGVDFALEWLYLVLPVIATLWGIKRLIGLFSTNRDES